MPPVIVRRIKKVHGHHGGAWKVAFADFAVAMMAFFLVLWLTETASDEQKQAVAGYFTDPVGFTEGGSPNVIDLEGAVTVTIQDNPDPSMEEQPEIRMREDTVEQLAEALERKRLEKLKEEIEDQIDQNAKLRAFRDQLILDITDEGLRIQIVDKKQRPMFDSGSSELKVYSEDILVELSRTIRRVPNKVSISGHTDATPYSAENGYSNWELSADRANAARRALLWGGLPEDRVAQIVGHGPSLLFDQRDPFSPTNRRISILILNKKTEAEIKNSGGPAADDDDTLLPGFEKLLDRKAESAAGKPPAGNTPAPEPASPQPVEASDPAGAEDGLNW